VSREKFNNRHAYSEWGGRFRPRPDLRRDLGQLLAMMKIEDRGVSQVNFYIVALRPDRYVAEISNKRTMSQLAGRHSGQNPHHLHAGIYSGLNARTRVFENQALLW
jgi:hypothetical protein